jgi:uncharacterized membrane protein
VTSAAPEAGPRRDLGEFQIGGHSHRNPYRRVSDALGMQDRIALAITGAIGTMYAVYILALIMAGWIIVQNVLGRGAFDPYPFAFLLFLGNIVQLLLMPLIMVGQNLQGRHTEARAEEEYDTVEKIFRDLGQTMHHLDAQDAELLRQTRLIGALVETLVPVEQRDLILARLLPSAEAQSMADLVRGPAPSG